MISLIFFKLFVLLFENIFNKILVFMYLLRIEIEVKHLNLTRQSYDFKKIFGSEVDEQTPKKQA